MKVRVVSIFSKNAKQHFQICSYIQKTTLNLIERLVITIYNTKTRNNTKLLFQKSIFSKHTYFPKLIHLFKSAFSAYFIGLPKTSLIPSPP